MIVPGCVHLLEVTGIVTVFLVRYCRLEPGNVLDGRHPQLNGTGKHDYLQERTGKKGSEMQKDNLQSNTRNAYTYAGQGRDTGDMTGMDCGRKTSTWVRALMACNVPGLPFRVKMCGETAETAVDEADCLVDEADGWPIKAPCNYDSVTL